MLKFGKKAPWNSWQINNTLIPIIINGTFLNLIVFQLTFFIKQESETLTEEQLPDFLAALQQLCLTLEAYNGAYNNEARPNAVESATQ